MALPSAAPAALSGMEEIAEHRSVICFPGVNEGLEQFNAKTVKCTGSYVSDIAGALYEALDAPRRSKDSDASVADQPTRASGSGFTPKKFKVMDMPESLCLG